MKTQTYFHSLRLSLVLFGNQYPSNGFFPPQFLIIRLTLASVRALRSSMRCRSSALKSPRRCFSRLRRKRATSSRSIGGFGIERIIASIIYLYKDTTFILNTNTVKMKNLFLNTIFFIYIIISYIIRHFCRQNYIIIIPVKLKTNYIMKMLCTTKIGSR